MVTFTLHKRQLQPKHKEWFLVSKDQFQTFILIRKLSYHCLTYVQPILNYGCKTWGFHKGYYIEKVHIKFCKVLLGVHKKAINVCVYNELGRIPLQ